MQDYNAFVKNTTHFQPRLILEIGGVDVSHRLIEKRSVTTDSLLDTPIYNVYTTSVARFFLDNSDDDFNTKNDSNFFTRAPIGRDQNGWRTFVKISVVFDNVDAPTTRRVLFVGYIEKIEELRRPRWVEVLVLDKSGLLQRSVVDNFGVDTYISLFGPRFTGKYTEADPVFSIPSEFLPISRESISSVRIGRTELEVLPEIPLDGTYADYKYVSVNHETGDLFLGAEPPNKENTSIGIRFKSAYRYRTPEALVSLLLDESGIYQDLSDDQKAFSKTLIKSPDLDLGNTPARWSSHGRPQSPSLVPLPAHATTDSVPLPVVRYIQSEGMGDERAFYFAGDRRLFRYRERGENVLDHYDTLWESVGDDLVGGDPIIQFVKVPMQDIFYVLTVGDWQGRVCRLWKIENALDPDPDVSTVSQNLSSGSDSIKATACHFYDYENLEQIYGYNPQGAPAADNRKSFAIYDGYLYYVSGSYTGSRGDYRGVSNGIRRLNLSNDVAEDVHVSTSPLTTDMSWDFVIDEENDKLYTFHCNRPSGVASYMQIDRYDISGGAKIHETQIIRESFPHSVGWESAMVSDVAFWNSTLYFVLTFSRDVVGAGFSELSKLLLVSNPTREVLKRYGNSLFSARGLVVHKDVFLDGGVDNAVFFVEGTWLSGLEGVGNFTYPTFADAGHLYSINSSGALRDRGPVWRTSRRTDGLGQYTSFCSNLLSVESQSGKDVLHLVAGYGLLANPAGYNSSQGTIHSTDVLYPEVRDLDNFMWLQYGQELVTKLSVFPTNGSTVWSLLEQLAIICDFEVGFTSGQDELEDSSIEDLNAVDDAVGYLFFRPRVDKVSGISLDERDIVGVSSELDTLLVFNHVSVPVGSGVWIEESDDRDIDEPIQSFPVPSRLLRAENYPWAEWLALGILDRHKEALLKVHLPVKFMPQVERGELIHLTSEYHSFENLPFRVTQVKHDTNQWQTTIEARESFVENVPLRLPVVEDINVRVGDSFSIELPEATGGVGDRTYSLDGLVDGNGNVLSWLTFTNSSRVLAAVGAGLGSFPLTYLVSDTIGASNPRRFFLNVTPLPEPSGSKIAAGISSNTSYIYLIDTEAVGSEQARRYTGADVRVSAHDFSIDAVSEIQNSVIQDVAFVPGSPREIVMIRKSSLSAPMSGNDNRPSSRLQWISSTGTQIRSIDLDAGSDGNSVRMPGEPPGDWRGVAYHPVDRKLYVMNFEGAIRVYNLDGSFDGTRAHNLNLCADWLSIAFANDNGVVTLLTLVGNLPTVLGWDLSMSQAARFSQKDVVLSDTNLNWMGIAVDGSGDLLACREGEPGFSRFDR